MREPFRGRIPDALLYHSEHNVWLRREGDELVIGATSYGAYFAGEILAFTPKRVGAEIELGRSLGVVEVAKTLVAIHAPVSMRLTATNSDAVAPPFVYAAAAAAMDAEVEIHFSGRTVRLLVADAQNREIKVYMKEVAAEGVRFLGCSTALKRHVREGEKMVAEFAGAAGAATYAQRALDPEWRTLVF
ncbi:MAG TPA: hypothetical protein VH600_16375 [Burkholderiales bacterium]|jgi:glycine cleavage system H lipoate-binding protein